MIEVEVKLPVSEPDMVKAANSGSSDHAFR